MSGVDVGHRETQKFDVFDDDLRGRLLHYVFQTNLVIAV